MKNTFVALLSLAAIPFSAHAEEDKNSVNGFDLSNLTIKREEVHRPLHRDAIPPINKPQFTDAMAMKGLEDSDLVMTYSSGEHHRAYPLRILDFHEVVNDTVDGKPISVTYCPLCGSGLIIDGKLGDKTLTFGVSGMLYKSDVLLYDRQTESLWSQLEMEAVSGPMAGKSFNILISGLETFADWKKDHPNGKVLNFNTGHKRPYQMVAYEKYKNSDKMHPKYGLKNVRPDLPHKAWIIGILYQDKAIAVALDHLQEKGELLIPVGDQSIKLTGKPGSHESHASIDGKSLPTVRAYWFSWQAFYPETTVIK